MGVDHLGEAGLKQEVRRLWSAIRKISKATLQNGAIGRAGLRVYDGGRITIEDGGLYVTGTASVTGTLTGSGQFTWTGPMDISGSQSVTGPVTFDGAWTFRGNGSISGDVSLTGDLTVSGGGSIKAGAITIDPSARGGSIKFTGGPEIYASGSSLSIYSVATGAWIDVTSNQVRVNGPGLASVVVNSSGVRFVGVAKVTKAGIPSGCYYKGSDGYLYEG